MIDLPYFDLLLEGRKLGDPAARAFERFVHWGYWEDPSRARRDGVDFSAAMERLNEEVLSEARIEDHQAVLDSGCGFGGTLAALNAGRRGMRLTGLNIDARQLAVAREQVRPGNGNELSWVEGDACALPFEAGSFDRALAVECIFHFPSRRKFLQEAARVLRPGGLLALSDFVPVGLGLAGGPVGRWIEREIGKGYGSVSGWPDGDYRAMARAAGLEITADRDVTAETLPTYPIIIDLIHRGGMGAAEGRMLWPTRWLHLVSRLRLVRYRILGFRKP